MVSILAVHAPFDIVLLLIQGKKGMLKRFYQSLHGKFENSSTMTQWKRIARHYETPKAFIEF